MVELLVHGLDFTKPDHICAAAAACVPSGPSQGWASCSLPGEFLLMRDGRSAGLTSGQRHLPQGSRSLITLGRRPKGLRATNSYLTRRNGASDPIACWSSTLM